MIVPKKTSEFDIFPRRVNISPTQDQAIQKLTRELETQAPAKSVFLADRYGQVLYFSKNLQDINQPELGALLAGDFAAIKELGRLTRTEQDYQLILREGEKLNSFTAEAGNHLIVFVLTDSDVPLGWARLVIQEATERLAEIVTEPSSTNSRGNLEKSIDEFGHG